MNITNQNINDYLNLIKNKWLEASESFPDFLFEIPADIKRENEQYLQTKMEELKQQINRYSKLPFLRKRWSRKTKALITDFLYKENIIGIHKAMDASSIDAFYKEILDFINHARAFSPELLLEDLGQALRNYIVYQMFKKLHNVNTGFSRAGFGYSMLYPFTDNYIDSQTITEEEKQAYNRMIKDKIQGRPVYPTSIHQGKTCELLQALESDYEGDREHPIFILLLMILDAQAKSLQQQQTRVYLTPEERLDISVYKGGISVLIDRFLVNKEVTEDDIIFYLGMGLFLQLADDLQDIGSDHQQGWQTIFTVDLQADKEEAILNKLLHFIHNIMASYQAENEVIKNFFLSNCYQLVYISLAGSSNFFSKEYQDRIDKLLPVSFPFLQDFRSGLLSDPVFSDQKNQTKILDAIIL